jgi:hypothetical protein
MSIHKYYVKSIRFNKQLSMSKILKRPDYTTPEYRFMDQMYNGFYTRYLLRLCICCTHVALSVCCTLTFFNRNQEHNYTNRHSNIQRPVRKYLQKMINIVYLLRPCILKAMLCLIMILKSELRLQT